MYSITDLKKNTIIQLDGQPYKVVEYAQKQMGRGGSIVNTKLKNLIDGSVVQKTFKGQDKIEPADVGNQKMQFLYADSAFHFMNNETYEQIELSSEVVGDGAGYLKEGDEVQIQMFDGNPISIDLPVKLPLKVVTTPDVVKGDTQSTVQKEAELETGIKVQVPIFIKEGDIIIVDTRDGSYVERQK